MKVPNKNAIVLVIVFFSSLLLYGQSKTVTQYFNDGVAAQNNEKWYEASQNFIEALRFNDAYSDAWLHLAQCSYQLSEFDLVLEQLNQAEKYSKNDNSISNLRGMTYIAMGKFDEARSIFSNVIKNTPNDIEARFGLAELDLFNGKITGAEKQYSEALKRQNKNRKALLSLALVSAQLGKNENAKKYINQALSSYSNEAEVHYLAAIVSAMRQDFSNAEKHCRVAVEVDGDYDKAYELLAKLRYFEGDYDEVISICDFRIGRNRTCPGAWYLKGCAQKSNGNTENAIETWSTGLQITPDDEIMRAALELAVAEVVPFEDSRRGEWSLYHIAKARDYVRRYDNASSSYEYQRALKLQPNNDEARMAFASMLELNGMHELYLDQLLFIQQTGDLNNSSQNTELGDKIEAYENLLQDSLAKKWNVQPFYLDKTRWKIGIFYKSSSVISEHADYNKITAEYSADLFKGITSAAVEVSTAQIASFGEAYQKARTSGLDYFVILSFDEGSRDVSLNYEMYSARTGTKLLENSLYATANARYANVLRRFRSEILEHLTVKANILNRNGKILLADIGKSENIREGAIFDVVRRNSIQTSPSVLGVSYSDDNVLGKFTVTSAGEEVCEGLLEYKGFYDRVNLGDELVLVYMPKSDEQNASQETVNSNSQRSTPVIDTAPSADVNGNSNEIKTGLAAEDLGIRRTLSFIDIIRSVR